MTAEHFEPGPTPALPGLTPALQRSYQANIRRFYLFRFLMNLQLWFPIWVIYLKDERGLSLTQVTALDAPYFLVMVLAEIPTGAVADRFGRKVSLALGALVYSFALFVFGIADGYVLILGSYIAWAIALTLISGADSAFFFDSLKAVGREAEFEKLWGRMRSVASVATLLALLLGAPVAAATTLWLPVLLGAATMALAFVICLTFHEPPHLDEGEEQLSLLKGTREAAKLAFQQPALRWIIWIGASISATTMAVQILAQPFLEHHNVSVGNFGWFLVPGSLLGILASAYAYRITRSVGVERVVAMLGATALVALVFLGTWDSLGAVAFIPLVAMVMSGTFPVFGSYINHRVPSSRRATVMSLYSLVISLMLGVLEPALGFIGDRSGLPAAHAAAAVFLAATVIPAYFVWAAAHRREGDRESPTVAAPALPPRGEPEEALP